MTQPGQRRGGLALTLAVATVALGAALAGCGQSSDTTSTGGAGGGSATTAPATTSTSSSASSSTTSSTTTPGVAAGAGPLNVSPATGSPQSVIHFAFTAPADALAGGSDQVTAGLSVVGPQKTGCIGLGHRPVTSMAAGQPTTVSLGPAQLGGNWCPGTYTARVDVLARPKCSPGMMCPQFIRVVAMYGPATFKISP